MQSTRVRFAMLMLSGLWGLRPGAGIRISSASSAEFPFQTFFVLQVGWVNTGPAVLALLPYACSAETHHGKQIFM